MNDENKEQKTRLQRFREWLNEPTSETADKIFIGILGVLFAITSVIFMGMLHTRMLEKVIVTYEDKHIEQVTYLREQLGSETQVYPRNSELFSGTYYVVTPDEEVFVTSVWSADDSFNFETEQLKEPYTTRAQRRNYERFVDARRHNDRQGDPFNNND